MTISHESSSSAASNRVWCPGAADLVLPAPAADEFSYVDLVYSATQLRWIVIDNSSTDIKSSQFNIYSQEINWSGGIHDGYADPILDSYRDGYQTFDATANEVAHSFSIASTTLDEIVVKVIAKRVDVIGDAAVFLLRGTWLNNSGSLIQVAAPEVVYGEPTDAVHCTAGATTWLAQLGTNGTTVQVQVTGQSGATINWSIVREATITV